jgi:phage protein D
MRVMAIRLSPNEVTSYHLTFPDRGSVGAVKTQAHDTKTGSKIAIVIPNPDAPVGSSSATHTDRHIYPNPSAAKAAAKAKLSSMNRQTASGQLELRGRADLAAEKSVELQGFKQEVDGAYLIESVTHQVAGQSWSTSVEISAGRSGKAKAGHTKPPQTHNDRGHPQRPVTCQFLLPHRPRPCAGFLVSGDRDEHTDHPRRLGIHAAGRI